MDIEISGATLRGPVTLDQNKAVIRRFTAELINTGSAAVAGEIIAPDAALYFAGSAEALRGPAGFLQALGMLQAGFPDIRWTLEDLVAEADTVAARFTFRGTHRGPFLGVPPTGRSIEGQGMAFFRLAQGKIIEDRALPNLLGVLQQLGAAPAP